MVSVLFQLPASLHNIIPPKKKQPPTHNTNSVQPELHKNVLYITMHLQVGWLRTMKKTKFFGSVSRCQKRKIKECKLKTHRATFQHLFWEKRKKKVCFFTTDGVCVCMRVCERENPWALTQWMHGLTLKPALVLWLALLGMLTCDTLLLYLGAAHLLYS